MNLPDDMNKQMTGEKNLTQYITQEKLDVFSFPSNSCLVIYDANTRKALFFRKVRNGYHLFLTRNKRAKPIIIRPGDYVLTVDLTKRIILGDTHNVFHYDG